MKKRMIISVVIFAILLASLSAFSWFKPRVEFSESERRPLAEKPTLSIETILSGAFQQDFETFTADQFPMRDTFRALKANISTYLFNKKDNNGLFYADGHLSKLEYPVNLEMVKHAQERFQSIYDMYLKETNTNVYLSLIPDKNYFLAEKNGYLSIDYASFINDFKSRFPNMTYIDVLPYLSIENYYKTDSHWKQETLLELAKHVAQSMGKDAEATYQEHTLQNPFYGVYVGQSALNVKPDTIKYLSSDTLSNCTVSYFDNGKAEEGALYNINKGNGKDPYELFLSGTTPLVQIENPNAKTSDELVIFRDSYMSSLAPLLVECYSKITLVDIRYMDSKFLHNFVTFDNQDVLFMYSTTLINNSMALR